MTGSAAHPIRLGLVGYGTGGKYFHSPFIDAADGIELAGIVARAETTRASATADWPGVPIFASLTELLASGVDAVTITTPPQTRRDLVLEAIAAGVHVVADKPFAPTADGGRELAAAADEAGLMLSVFHNRRWDADLLTVASVIADGSVGTVERVHSTFDLDQVDSLETGVNGGLLHDLGSHLVDQVLTLLGPVSHVSAVLDFTDAFGPRTNSGFVLTLRHTNGAASIVSASKLNHVEQREFRVYGTEGSFVSSGSDVQAQAIFAGRRPTGDRSSWGYEDDDLLGTLSTADGKRRVPSAQGDYTRFYEQFAAALRGTGEQPVPAHSALATLEVLDAARRSDAERITVALG